MKSTQFKVLIGPDGASTVSQDSKLVAPSEAIARRIRGSVEGLEEILTGFFSIWSGTAIKALFPDPDSEYQLESFGENYRLTYTEASDKIAIVMNHEFAAEELKTTTSEGDAKVYSHWSRNSDGLILTGYQANLMPVKGEPMQLSFKVDYQEVDGLRLPSTVDAVVPVPGGSIPIRLVFTDYQVKKRDARANP